VLSSDKDPKCAGVSGYCDDTSAVTCNNGYAARREDCASSAPTPMTCVGAICETPIRACGDGIALECDAPPECGEKILGTVVPGAPPAASGGAIQDGVYLLEKLEIYGASASFEPASFQITRRFERGVLSVVVYSGDAPDASSGAYTTTGNSLTFDQSCPSASPTTFEYTAGDASLTLIERLDPLVYVLTHRKR
jgi:hypothetical protein